MVIDTHAHLSDEAYSNVDVIVKELNENNVSYVLLASSDAETSKQSFELSQKYTNLYTMVGVHPSETSSYTKNFQQFICEIANNKKVIAIGEIGLDYHYEGTCKDSQKECFENQIKLADNLNLPIVLHIRDAMGDTIEILNNNKQYIRHGGIVHCYSGSIESYEILKKFGFKFAFGGAITFKNSRNIECVVRHIPLTDILLETDCPYLTPVPLRGQAINEPKYVNYVAQKIAEIKDVSVCEVEQQTTKNVFELFPKMKK